MKTSRLEVFFYAKRASTARRMHQEAFGNSFMMDILACGLQEVPQEPCAYYLPGERGQICGLMGTHVDDLLWCGND